MINATDARKFVTGLSGYDQMVPVHQNEFNKAVDLLIQAVERDVADRISAALFEFSSHDPAVQAVNEVIDPIHLKGV